MCLDGTLVPTDRIAARAECGHRRWYSGKHHAFGGSVQVLADPSGFPLWTSAVRPGSTHDLTAARELVLPALYPHAAPGLPLLADVQWTDLTDAETGLARLLAGLHSAGLIRSTPSPGTQHGRRIPAWCPSPGGRRGVLRPPAGDPPPGRAAHPHLASRRRPRRSSIFCFWCFLVTAVPCQWCLGGRPTPTSRPVRAGPGRHRPRPAAGTSGAGVSNRPNLAPSDCEATPSSLATLRADACRRIHGPACSRAHAGRQRTRQRGPRAHRPDRRGERWARTADRVAATEPARRGLRARSEREADPEGVLDVAERARRADDLFTAHLLRLARASAQVRRRRALGER